MEQYLPALPKEKKKPKKKKGVHKLKKEERMPLWVSPEDIPEEPEEDWMKRQQEQWKKQQEEFLTELTINFEPIMQTALELDPTISSTEFSDLNIRFNQSEIDNTLQWVLEQGEEFIIADYDI